jgi:hypothetical protein
MWMLRLIFHLQIGQLHIEILIHTMQRSPQLKVILQLHNHFMPDKRLEELEEMLRERKKERERPQQNDEDEDRVVELWRKSANKAGLPWIEQPESPVNWCSCALAADTQCR